MPAAPEVLQDPFFRALVASLALIVVADDEIHFDEVTAKRRVLEDVLGRMIPDNAIERCAELVRMQLEDVKDTVIDRAKALSQEQKTSVLAAAAGLVLADRKVRADEEVSLRDLAGCLGLDRTQADVFLARARAKHRA